MVQIEERPPGLARPPAETAVSPRDMRQLIPALGLREYWYPALEARRVKNKPVGRTICGVDLVFFNGTEGEVQCLWNVCPHRGGSLMHGDCHFTGTISCPYHGWTFDGSGELLAVIPEGPESRMPGKVWARKYPTQTYKGMVFVWMGDGEPAPIEEDVPPEFFDDTTQLLFTEEYWAVQWNLALENGGDAHVPYLHRNSFRHGMRQIGWVPPIPGPQEIVNGRAVVSKARGGGGGPRRGYTGPYQRYFPTLDAKWPKHRWRLLWTWIFEPALKREAALPPWDAPHEWAHGHHLPCMYRGVHKRDMYTRNSIAVTENLSRQIYFKATRRKSWLGRAWEVAYFKLYWRWSMITNFSKQDYRAVNPQRYDTPEHLSPTDIHEVMWRRLVLQARGMMQSREVDAIPVTEAEKTSYELDGKSPVRHNGEAGNSPPPQPSPSRGRG
jgi:phenylpropionate dioxygenase-like ring-hydroxylating dioxygenase large terminal subunit